MNNNGETPKQDTPHLPSLTLPTQIAFLALIGLLGFLWAVGALGALGIILMILASALNAVFALSSYRSPKKLLLLLGADLLVYAAATIYYGSAILSVSALYPVAFGLAVFLSVGVGMRRAGTVVMSVIFAFIPLGVLLAYTVIEVYGTLSAAAINEALDTLLEPVRLMYLELADKLEELTIGKNEIDLMMRYIKALLPSMAAVSLMVIAYVVTLAVRLIANLFKVSELLPSGYRIGLRARKTEDGPAVEIFRETVQWRLELDNVSAVVYIVSYIVTMLFASSDNISVPYIVAMNLMILLTPGFLYCGLRDVILGLRGKASIGKVSRVVLILGIIMLFINPLTVTVLMSVLGIVVTFRENRARREMTDNRRNNNES